MHCQIRKIGGSSEVKGEVRSEVEKEVKIKIKKETMRRFVAAGE